MEKPLCCSIPWSWNIDVGRSSSPCSATIVQGTLYPTICFWIVQRKFHLATSHLSFQQQGRRNFRCLLSSAAMHCHFDPHTKFLNCPQLCIQLHQNATLFSSVCYLSSRHLILLLDFFSPPREEVAFPEKDMEIRAKQDGFFPPPRKKLGQSPLQASTMIMYQKKKASLKY